MHFVTLFVIGMKCPIFVFYFLKSLESGSLYNISTNVEQQLVDLLNQQFTYDYEFHVAVADIFGSIKDPHLSYRAPCYTAFLFLQPFRIGMIFSLNCNFF